MSATQWRDVISEHCRSARLVFASAAAAQLASGAVLFEARDLVDLLLASRRCSSRLEAVELGDKLRARDIIRPATPSSDTRFRDDKAAWVCRAGEEATTANSFSVPALLNARHHYVLAAPFLKQGAFFLNPRVFVLDRTSRRLYVFTTETSPSPRYYIDLSRPTTAVVMVNSSGTPVAAEAMGWDTRSSVAGGSSSSSSSSKRGSIGGRQDRFASRDTDGLGTDTSSGEEFGDRDDRSVGSGSRSHRRNRRASSLASLGSGGGDGGSGGAPTPGRGGGGSKSSAAASASFSPWAAFTSLVLGRKGPEAGSATFLGGGGGGGRSGSSSGAGRSSSAGGGASENYGFVLSCANPPLRLAAFSPVLRRVRVWTQALRDTIGGEPLHQQLSHTQVRLRNLQISLPALAAGNGRSSLEVSASMLGETGAPPSRQESASLRSQLGEAGAAGLEPTAPCSATEDSITLPESGVGSSSSRGGCGPSCQCGPGCRCACCGSGVEETQASAASVGAAQEANQSSGGDAAAAAPCCSGGTSSCCGGGCGAGSGCCGGSSSSQQPQQARREDSLDDLLLAARGGLPLDPDAPFRVASVRAMLALPQRAVDARLQRLGFAPASGDSGEGDESACAGSEVNAIEASHCADLAEVYTPVLQGFVRAYGGGDLSTLAALAEQPGLLGEACGVYIVSHQRYIIERAAAAMFPVVCLPPPVTPVPSGPPLSSARPGGDCTFTTDETGGLNGSFDTLDSASRAQSASNELHEGDGFFGRLDSGSSGGTAGVGAPGRSILSVLRSGSSGRHPAASGSGAGELGSPTAAPPSSSLPAPTPGIIVAPLPTALPLARQLSTEEALSLFEAERSLLRLALADAFSRVSRLLDADVSEAALRRAEADMRSQIKAHMQRARSGTFSVRITAEAVGSVSGALLPPVSVPPAGDGLSSVVSALEARTGGAVRLSVGLVRASAAPSEEAPEVPAPASGGGEEAAAAGGVALPPSSSGTDLATSAGAPPRPLPGSVFRGQERITPSAAAAGEAPRPRAATTGALGGNKPPGLASAGGRAWAHILDLPQATREAWVLHAARIYSSMAAALDRAGGTVAAASGSVSSGMPASASAPPITAGGATRQRSMSGTESHVYGSRALAGGRSAFSPEAALLAAAGGASTGAARAGAPPPASPPRRPVQSMYVGKAPPSSAASIPQGVPFTLGSPTAGPAEEAASPAPPKRTLLPMQPHPLPGTTEAKVIEVVISGVKGLLVERTVRALSGSCLETGAALPLAQVHPVADLTQRVCSQIARVFGPAALAALNLSYEDTRAQLKQDVKFYTARLALLVKDWPKAWAHGFGDWGATSAYLAPSESFRAAVTAGLDSSIPEPEVAAAVATAWRAVSRLAKAVRLTERDFAEVAEEAVCKVVFSVLRGVIHGSYRHLHANEDGLLKNAYSVVWGVTTTQLSLPKELRCDAAMPTGPIVPPGAFDAILISSAVSLRVEPPLLPLSSLLGAQQNAVDSNNASAPPPATSPRVGLGSFATPAGDGGGVPKTSSKMAAVLSTVSPVLLPVSSSSLHAAGSASSRPASSTILPFPSSPPLLPSPSPRTGTNPLLSPLPPSTSGAIASPRPASMSISRSISVGAGLELYSAGLAAGSSEGVVVPAALAALGASQPPAAPLRQPLPGCFPAYALGRPEAPAAFAPLMSALQTFQLLSLVPDPPTKLRVVAATVDTLCRCITVHRQGLAAASAAVAAAAQAGDVVATSRRPMPSLGRVEAAHINADDLLGLLVWVVVHTAVPHLFAEVDVAFEFASEPSLIERTGFLLASLQAAVMYASTQDVIKTLKCGHCEGTSGEPIAIRCKACGRLLCPACDAAIHDPAAMSEAAAATHVRVAAPVTLLPPSDRAGADREWSLRRIKERLIGRGSRAHGDGSGAGGGGQGSEAGSELAWTGRERAWSAGSAPSAGVIRRLAPSLKSAAQPATASALTAPGGGSGGVRRSRFEPPPGGGADALSRFPLPLVDTGVSFDTAHSGSGAAPRTDSSLDTEGSGGGDTFGLAGGSHLGGAGLGGGSSGTGAPTSVGGLGDAAGPGGRSLSGASARTDRLVETLRAAAAASATGASLGLPGTAGAAFSLVPGFSLRSGSLDLTGSELHRRASGGSDASTHGGGGGFGLRLHGDDDGDDGGSSLEDGEDDGDMRDGASHGSALGDSSFEDEGAANVSYGGLYLPAYPVDGAGSSSSSGFPGASRSLGGSMLGLVDSDAATTSSNSRLDRSAPGSPSAYSHAGASNRSRRTTRSSARSFEGSLANTSGMGGGGGGRVSLFGEGALDTTTDEEEGSRGYLSEGGRSDAEAGASSGGRSDGALSSAGGSRGALPLGLSGASVTSAPRSPQRPHTSSGLHITSTPSSSSLRRSASLVRTPMAGGLDAGSDALSVASSAGLTAGGSPVLGADGRSLSASSPAVQRSASKAALVLEGSPFVSTRITSAAVALIASPELSRYMSFEGEEGMAGQGRKGSSTAPSSPLLAGGDSGGGTGSARRACGDDAGDDSHPRF